MTPNQSAEQILSLRSKTKAEALHHDLIEAAVRYSRLRVDWALSDRDGRATMDHMRATAHDVLIDCSNILSRAMVREGEDISWREALGNDRKLIGDMACHLHCLIGVQAR